MKRKESFKPSKWFDQFLSRYRYSRVFQVLNHDSQIKSIVDMGCGKGTLVNILNQKGYQAQGIDLQAAQHVLAADLNEDLPFESNQTDFITSLANLEHLDNPDKNLSEIYRMLKPKGQLMLTTPSTAAKPVLEFLAFRLKWIDEREILDHKRYYSKKTLTQALTRAGFKEFKINYFQMGFNLAAWACKS